MFLNENLTQIVYLTKDTVLITKNLFSSTYINFTFFSLHHQLVSLKDKKIYMANKFFQDFHSFA